MKKVTINRIALVIVLVLTALIFLSACEAAEPRLPVVYTYNPGPAFQTNFDHEDDPRRQIRCVVMFKVLDEKAVDELDTLNFVIRNSILAVLGELTMPELTTDKDLSDIAQRLVDRVNEDLATDYPLILSAYFTEFQLT